MRRWRSGLALALVPFALACSRESEEAPATAPEAAAQAGAARASGEDEIEEPFSTAMIAGDEQEQTAAALQRYQAECGGATTPECKRLQWRLEYALYEDLRVLQRAGVNDDELLHVGAAADTPQLKAFALDAIRARGLRPEEAPLVIAALNDPYPLARAAAAQLASQLPDEKWSRMQVRETGHDSAGIAGLIAGVRPDAAALGAAPYPGATYWYFASDPKQGELFTTSDSPDAVAAFYAKGARAVLRGEEIRARVEAAKQPPDPSEMMRLMQEALAAGQDPSTVMGKLGEGMPAADVDWTAGIDDREGILEPRYVVLEETKALGKTLPARVVAVFQDEAMGATAMIFRGVPKTPALPPDMSTPEGMARYMRVQEILGSPDASLRGR